MDLEAVFNAIRNPSVASILVALPILVTAASHGLEWALPRLRAIAIATETRTDDRAVTALEVAAPYLHALAKALDYVIPRVQIGGATKANRAKRDAEAAETARIGS